MNYLPLFFFSFFLLTLIKYNIAVHIFSVFSVYIKFTFFTYLFGMKHTNHANKHNMPRSMNRTLTDMNKIIFDSYVNQYYRIKCKL